MCFWKSKQSKVLIAKRDIKVYKIGVYADEGIFNTRYIREFSHKVGCEDSFISLHTYFINHYISFSS